MKLVRWFLLGALLSIGGISCGSASHPAVDTDDIEVVCKAYQNPDGSVRGGQSFERNRAHLLGRIQVFRSIADLLDLRDEVDLAIGARTIATKFQTAVENSTNDALLTEVATVTADPILIAIANELDRSMTAICSPGHAGASTTASTS